MNAKSGRIQRCFDADAVTFMSAVAYTPLLVVLATCALVLNLSLFHEICIAAPRLARVAKVRTQYLISKDRLRVSWSAVPHARRYKVSLRRGDSSEILSLTRATHSADLSVEGLTEGVAYEVAVIARGDSSYRSSAVKARRFIFTTRVKGREEFRELETRNSSGRSGYVYLPKNYRLKSYPLMLLIHGSSIDGRTIAQIFKALAKRKQFVVVAPDSNNSFGWEISTDLNAPTRDQLHIAACLDEVLALPHLTVLPQQSLIAGVSAGGAVAAFHGSNDSRFSHIAVLHGGVDLDSLGGNTAPFWLSTGTTDALRTPQELKGYHAALPALGFASITYREFDAAHAVPIQEREALIEWWLGS